MPFIPSSFNFLWSADLSIPIKSAVFEMFPWFFFNWVVKYSFSKYFLASLSGDEKDLSNKFLLILEEIEGFKILKSKEKWGTSPAGWKTGTDDTLYKDEVVLDFVQDFVFLPHDEDGKIITSTGSFTPDLTRAYDVRTVDVGLIIRSSKPFYRNDSKAGGAIRKIVSLTSGRNISEKDKFLREIITVTANARNVGLN